MNKQYYTFSKSFGRACLPTVLVQFGVFGEGALNPNPENSYLVSEAKEILLFSKTELKKPKANNGLLERI